MATKAQLDDAAMRARKDARNARLREKRAAAKAAGQTSEAFTPAFNPVPKPGRKPVPSPDVIDAHIAKLNGEKASKPAPEPKAPKATKPAPEPKAPRVAKPKPTPEERLAAYVAKGGSAGVWEAMEAVRNRQKLTPEQSKTVGAAISEGLRSSEKAQANVERLVAANAARRAAQKAEAES